ncbi:MAG: nickel-dependent hydrogenase large subunit [Chloroflexi bacterium]|nr:nickel-dependent hydrogenase large subunit [Chloroflexota bacterium]
MRESATLKYRKPRRPTPTPPAPTVTPEPSPQPGRRIVIDPLTRIEGHLRLEVNVDNGVVTDAWSSGTMFRGVELILKGRDPREAWAFTQRLCGVCTTVHALASVRAVENALGITVPDNARLIRNLIDGAQFVQDHVIHFYHLHALDWVDVISALSADPNATSSLARSISDWPNSSVEYFARVKARLQNVVNSGQLGLFANGYWGHPAYVLPPEANLLAAAHYLEALDWQREYIKMHAYLGGKNPHPQTYLVGGMATPVGPEGTAGITPSIIQQMRVLSQKAIELVSKVYLKDLLLVASQYPDWAGTGGGYGNLLAFGDFPEASSSQAPGGDPAHLWMPQGIILGGDLGNLGSLDPSRIEEYVAHSYYRYVDGDGVGKHPYQGETLPDYTGPQPPFDALYVDAKYSWLKAPRYNGTPMEVGPLARVGVAYAAGHPRIRQLVDDVLAALGAGPEALFSTLGRVAARGIETLAIAERMLGWLDELEANIGRGDLAIHNGAKWDPATWPVEAQGWGTTEAPRGALGHWVKIANGKIANYQMVVPTTWNGSPRDAAGNRGAWEQALIGTPVADPRRPVEILRTVHSFDPCLACSVHLVDAGGEELGRVTFGTF